MKDNEHMNFQHDYMLKAVRQENSAFWCTKYFSQISYLFLNLYVGNFLFCNIVSIVNVFIWYRWLVRGTVVKKLPMKLW